MTGWLALAAIAGYVVDALGFGVQPWFSLGAALLATGLLAWRLPRGGVAAITDLAAWAAIVGFLIAVLLRVSWPALVPPGRGPDLTHHLLLVDYIEHSGHLVHDRSLDGAMGEMAHYTPASHLLAVMAGRWFGSDGLHTFFPLTLVSSALTAGFVFLIARRHALAMPYALSAAIVLLMPSQYFFGAFTHDGFLSQTVSTLFATAMWWAVVVWDDRPGRYAAALVSIFLVATFLSWPIWLGPPLLVFLMLLRRDDLLPQHRWRQLALVLVPLAAIGIYHSLGRWGWMVIVRTSGAVLRPSLQSLGWLLPLLAAGGFALSISERRVRSTRALVVAMLLQAATLFVIAKAQGADTPYMAFKMVYFAIYPMAIFAAIALARLGDRFASREAAGWLMATLLLVIGARPALTGPRPVPVVDDDLYAAGQWLRGNVGSCADYLVADAETAYWLHLAVLGNPRSSLRMQEIDRYEPRAAMSPWITSEGRAYAIADLRLLPDEVRSRVDIVREFGHAGVIKGRGATMKGCD